MHSSLRVLGCSGSIDQGIHTTSFLIDDDILLDAGTGVSNLSIDELLKINYLFITHSHLDHICSIPLLADAVGSLRKLPLKIYGNAHTINSIKDHIFNNVIWPDFTRIPSSEHPFVTLQVMNDDEIVSIPMEKDSSSMREVRMVPANHSIPSNGYIISNSTGAIFFSGDTASCDAMWGKVNLQAELTHVILETSFDNSESHLANLSKHLHPTATAQELSKLLHAKANIWISHLKPQCSALIMDEIDQAMDPRSVIKPQKLLQGSVLKF